MAVFNIYRYQLLPTERQHQGRLFEYNSVADLIANKNKILSHEIQKNRLFQTKRLQTNAIKILKRGELYLFRVGVNRDLQRDTEDFKKETLDTWPNVLVVIWNDPDKQFIAVEKNPLAFYDTNAVINLIGRNLNHNLHPYRLGVYINPLFETHDFWHLVEEYQNKIQSVNFEFITPNMANISGAIAGALKEVARDTNSVENNLKLKAAEKSALNLDPNDRHTSSLVSYSSEGGGSIEIKIKGLRKKKRTGDNIKEVQVDQIDVKLNDPEELYRLLSSVFK